MQSNIICVSSGKYKIVKHPSIKVDITKLPKKFFDELDTIKGPAIFTPWYLAPDKKIFFAGGDFLKNTYLPMPSSGFEEDIGQTPGLREVQFNPLFFAVYNKEALKRIAPFLDFSRSIVTHGDFILMARQARVHVYCTDSLKVEYSEAYNENTGDQKLQKTVLEDLSQFAEKWSDTLAAKRHTPTVFHTVTGFPGGYCNLAEQVIKQLLKKNFDLYYKYIGGSNDDEPPAHDYMVDDLRADMGSLKLPQVALANGLTCFANSGRYKIAYTMGEVSGIPSNWVRVLNEMDEVWVPSEFSKLIFIDSGVTVPIFNVRAGVDPDYFHPGIKPFEQVLNNRFLFISNFAFGRRKGVDKIFEAYRREFDEDENVGLVLKCLPSYTGHKIKEECDKLYYRKGSARIDISGDVVEPYELGRFYTAGHCFLWPSRGEGFGLPPLEALACGVPVIATDYSSHTEFLKKDGVALPGVELLKYHLTPYDGTDSIYYSGFEWAEPDVNDLRTKMRKVFENRDEYKRAALKSSEIVRRDWTWEKSAKIIGDRLVEISRKLNSTG